MIQIAISIRFPLAYKRYTRDKSFDHCKRNKNKWIFPFVNIYYYRKDGILKVKMLKKYKEDLLLEFWINLNFTLKRNSIHLVFVDVNIVQYWIRWIAGNSFPLIISCIRYIEYSQMLLVFVYAARPTIKSWQCH